MIYATTVVRGATSGENHGGMYALDFERGEATEMLQWSDAEFDFRGRGGDRGLRGLTYQYGAFYVAAADRILVVSPSGVVEEEITNQNLGLLHEITPTEGGFWVVSTAHDSILRYDYQTKRFNIGVYLDYNGKTHQFDPKHTLAPRENVWHLNSVAIIDGKPCVSGLRLPGVFQMTREGFVTYGLPYGTHNARKVGHLLTYCDTAADALRIEGSKFPSPYRIRKEDGEARSNFMRGMTHEDETLYVGLSPARVYQFDMNKQRWGKSIVISDDFHVAVQSLCVGPDL